MAKAADAQARGDRQVARNRRAFFDFEVGKTFEAGLVLIGSEVRSLREGKADLTDAWVELDPRGEAWLKGMRIPPLKHAAFGHEERRARKLLLHAAQIEELRAGTERDGMTTIALGCYFKHNHAKVEIALARGKKRHDKRASVKEREANHDLRAALRRSVKR